MSEAMGWETHEGLYRTFDRYFVVKDSKSLTGYTTSGVDQNYYHWKPSENTKQAIRVAERVFTKYCLTKEDNKSYRCVGTSNNQVFEGRSKTMAKAICMAIVGSLKERTYVRGRL